MLEPAIADQILRHMQKSVYRKPASASVEDGRYFLSCAPLKLEGSDGCPVRAYLIEE